MSAPERTHLLSDPSVTHHDLESEWTLWCFIPPRSYDKDTDWSSFLREVVSFSSVEDFWAILNSCVSARDLSAGCKYYVFQRGVRPLWEDPGNVNGYCIYGEYSLKKDGVSHGSKSAQSVQGAQGVQSAQGAQGVQSTQGAQGARSSDRDAVKATGALSAVCGDCEERWISVVLSVICRSLPQCDIINGIEFNRRPSSVRIGVWTKPVSEGVLDNLKSSLLSYVPVEEFDVTCMTPRA